MSKLRHTLTGIQSGEIEAPKDGFLDLLARRTWQELLESVLRLVVLVLLKLCVLAAMWFDYALEEIQVIHILATTSVTAYRG